jgi:hypothetical protein
MSNFNFKDPDFDRMTPKQMVAWLRWEENHIDGIELISAVMDKLNKRKAADDYSDIEFTTLAKEICTELERGKPRDIAKRLAELPWTCRVRNVGTVAHVCGLAGWKFVPGAGRTPHRLVYVGLDPAVCLIPDAWAEAVADGYRPAFAKNHKTKPTREESLDRWKARRDREREIGLPDKPVYTITLEKAGRYHGKFRYTVGELPDLGATVTPELEAARWYILRGADPADEMRVKKPDEADGEDDVNSLAAWAGLYTYTDPDGSAIRGRPWTLWISKAVKADPQAARDARAAWFGNKKAGIETRSILKRELGLTVQAYIDAWREERAAEWDEKASWWLADKRYARKGSGMTNEQYARAKFDLLSWQADRVRAREDPEDADALKAKEVELGLK